MKVIGGRYRSEGELRDLGIGSAGGNVAVHESAILVDIERIELGSNVRIDPFCILSAAGGFIRIGSYVHVASHCDIFGGEGVVMEDFSGISQGVRIYSVSDDYSGRSLTNPTVPKKYVRTKRGKVSLGRHVIVGSGSVILPGVAIGEGTAVGALSLVRKSLEPWDVYAGNPLRRIGSRSRELLGDEGLLLGEIAPS
jgi:acetyltransferase-like isoleucine patch superfamily enzyme